ncbi:MAG: PQQ-like beta-propeller repeat protein [Planctomycetes bacterium]|nr:PQQ-like beta-propeller repeat protein [Planctomycetota bacterium]
MHSPFCSMKFAVVCITVAALAACYTCGAGDANAKTPVAAAADWPQFMGPNRDGVSPKSPKLLEVWPKEGLKLLWKSDALPAAPGCGIGNPVVADGRVYTFANTLLPMVGNMPFNAEFLTSWGWAADLPEDLGKKIDEAQFKNPKRAACKTKEEVDAYTNEFLGTLDAAQAKKFGDAIRMRLQRGGEAFNSGDLAWMATFQGKEIKTRQDFWKLCNSHFPGNMFHYWLGPLISKCADKMYANQQSGDTIICLNAADGKELWRKAIAAKAPYAPGNGVSYGFSGTPTIVKDKVYFSGSGGVYCIDAKKNGELVWQGKGEPSHTSSLVLNGVAYFMAGELAAFNADTGAELWRQPQIKNVFSSPAVWTHEGKTYLLCTSGSPDPTVICCVDPDNGKILWQTGTGYILNATPTTSGDILVARGKNGCVGFKITPQKAEHIWKSDVCGDAGANAVIFQEHVYCCGRTYNRDLVVVLDLKTGAVKLHQASANSPTCATPVVADGKIFTLEAPVGNVIAFKATPDKFELVGSMPQVKAADCSSVAVADGRLYVRLPDAIVCYDLTGAK